jgi:hypothetical protein
MPAHSGGFINLPGLRPAAERAPPLQWASRHLGQPDDEWQMPPHYAVIANSPLPPIM